MKTINLHEGQSKLLAALILDALNDLGIVDNPHEAAILEELYKQIENTLQMELL